MFLQFRANLHLSQLLASPILSKIISSWPGRGNGAFPLPPGLGRRLGDLELELVLSAETAISKEGLRPEPSLKMNEFLEEGRKGWKWGG